MQIQTDYHLPAGFIARAPTMDDVKAVTGLLKIVELQDYGVALLLHSFSEFYQRGVSKVGLGVDAGNLTGATRLYERAGMHIVEQADLYEKELRS